MTTGFEPKIWRMRVKWSKEFGVEESIVYVVSKKQLERERIIAIKKNKNQAIK